MFSGTRHGSVQCLGVIVENSRQGILTVDGGVLAIFIAYILVIVRCLVS